MADLKKSGQALIEGDEIVIRVAIEALPTIVDASPLAPAEFSVTDAVTFAAELVKELNREEEDGTTPIHRMFDVVILEAIEQGADGVEDYSDPEDLVEDV
jgi:hypothetical protein